MNETASEVEAAGISDEPCTPCLGKSILDRVETLEHLTGERMRDGQHINLSQWIARVIDSHTCTGAE